MQPRCMAPPCFAHTQALTLVCTLTTVGLLSGGLGLPHYHVRSNYILPVWVYDPKADEFRQANASVLRVIAGLWVAGVHMTPHLG